ncbi:hypothetical protein AB1K83_01285 [Sporosarcina sp. 179-K 3D1 HS]|uniref:hypothetical protein n=1 Tax=Sporosarcina sp. 179-K 3D1 HS TaxID=3232169 RepID=UPI0039A08635
MDYPIKTPLSGLPTAAVSQNRPLLLNEGQLFHGQVKQLFPGQMAEVQIGAHKLVAKLEVPMKAGDAYYFQVSAVKPELQLKIISGPLQGGEGQGRQLGALLEAMQLPKTAEMQSLLAFVMKQKLPMTRDQLLAAEQLVKLVPRAQLPEALATIQKLVDVKLPLTENHFRSVFGVQAKEGLHSALQSFSNAVVADSTVAPQTKESILAQLGRVSQPLGQATGGALLGQAILTLINPEETAETKFNVLQLLKSADILPPRTSLANIQQVLTSLQAEEGPVRPMTNTPSAAAPIQMPQAAATGTVESPKATVAQTISQTAPTVATSKPVLQQLSEIVRQVASAPQDQSAVRLEGIKEQMAKETTLSQPQKMELTSIVDRAMQSPPSAENTARFIQQLSQAIYRITAQQAIAEPFAAVSGQTPGERLAALTGQQGTERLESLIRLAERSDNPVMQKMVQAAETAMANALDGRTIKEAIQTVVRSFGLHYEAELATKEPDIPRLAESLKPQLLALMRDTAVTPAVREMAEALVMRMNGPLIQSGEVGVQHQLVMQVPLELFGRKIDSTLQWSGRMKEDGKIDPEYARVLFYLDLESIEKTVIDMQVQNRIVSVTIFNEDDTLKAIGAPMLDMLKKGLDQAGYTLSGVFFKPFAEEVKTEVKKTAPFNMDSQGVDFRI